MDAAVQPPCVGNICSLVEVLELESGWIFGVCRGFGVS